MWVVYAVLFSSYFKPSDAPRAMGFLLSVTTLGQVAATFTGGIVSETFSDKHTFLLAAAAGIIGFLLSLMIKKEEKDIIKEPVKLKNLLSVGKDRMLMLVSGLAILSQFLTFATIYGFTPVAASKLGASSYELGLLVTISALPGVISGALSGSFFGKRFGERNVIAVGFMMTAGSVLLIPFIDSLTVLFLTQIIGGFSKGMVFPLLMGMGIKNIPNDKRATAMGFYQAIYGLGMFLGPVVVGVMTDAVSLGTGFVITASLGFLAAVIAFMSLKKAQSDTA
jgi:predicted MFS family arabinose efflux permease